MQLLQQGSRLVLALALLLVLDSSVQGKTQESHLPPHPSVIFASPGVHTNDYIHFKVQNVLYRGTGGKEKGFGGAELFNVSLIKFGIKINETLRQVWPHKHHD